MAWFRVAAATCLCTARSDRKAAILGLAGEEVVLRPHAVETDVAHHSTEERSV
jgi:hypothetical protein